MTIFRRRHTSNFTTISNRLFDDDRLAADEVGILAYLLSRPHDWEVRRPALQRRWGIGREAMKRIMFAWLRTGWCAATRVRAPNGTSYVVYDIRDVPGPDMTDDEVRRALSLGSSDAPADDSEVIRVPEEVPETGSPPTGYPSLADPSPVYPYVADISRLNTDLPRDESNQNLEREALRSREKHAVALAEFKRRWPTIATDDQGRVDKAWFDLSLEEGEAALLGIAPFLANLKAHGRGKCCAGWKYLGEKRWTLLVDNAAPGGAAPSAGYPRDSIEAKAVFVLHDIAGKTDALWRIYVRGDRVYYSKPVPPRIAALANAPHRDAWPVLTHQQAGAWEALLREAVTVQNRRPLREGERAPWPWPPKVDGTLSPVAPPGRPPLPELSDEEAADFTA